MSRSQDPDTESLDDKIAKPVFYGAIPLYEGTDARLAKAHGYPSLNLRRENYESDDDFPQDIAWPCQGLVKNRLAAGGF